MEKIFYTLILVLFCFAQNGVKAQNIDIEEYHQEDGLPTDLIKALDFDENGYLWIAADGGVVKLEGNSFVPVKNIEGNSNYYKNLLFTKSFGLITASDDGIVSINYREKQLPAEYIKNILNFENWPEIIYPKTIYEATDSSLWIGTNNGIVHLTKTSISFIILPQNCSTTHYVRNHQFFEIENQLYVICQKGYLFKIDAQNNKAINIPWPFESSEVYSALATGDNTVLIGNADGLVEVFFPEDGKPARFRKLNFPYAVSVIKFHKGFFYLGTWSQGAFKAQFSQGTFNYEFIGKTENQTINDLQFDSDDQLWLATNFGIKLIRNLIFKRQFIEYTDDYIQDISEQINGDYYFTDGWRVAKVNSKKMEFKPFFMIKDDLIMRLLPKEKEVWMATQSGKILIQKGDGSMSEIDFSAKGKEILAITDDKYDNVWVLQKRSVNALIKIQPDFTIKEYVDATNTESNFLTIEHNLDGELYVGGHGAKSYLYKYDTKGDSLINISKPVTGLNKPNFEINDMAFSNSGKMILGTSEGLWEQKDNKLERIDLGEMNLENVSALCFDKQERLWFVNASGLVLRDSKQLTVFNKYDGLPSTTVSPRNLLIDNYQTIWVGTNLGMASGIIQYKNAESPKPDIISVESGFNQYSTEKPGRFLVNSTIKISFATALYPIRHLNYKYCLSNGELEKWVELKKNSDYLVFENLKPGKYLFKLQAKGKGYCDWSDTVSYEFIVYKKWYTQIWAFGIFYVLLIIIIAVYLRFLKIRNEREKKKLEAIIEQRTKTLLEQNEELKLLNSNLIMEKERTEEAIKSKDRFFSIVAHDLKSPFNTLIGFSELLANNRDQIPEESMQEVFEEMLKTSENTYKLLQNLLDWARSQTGALVIEKRMIDVSLLFQEVLDTILPAAKQKNIKIVIHNYNILWIYADVALMATSIRNILSNAIKFSHPESTIEISYHSEGSDWVVIKIKDQGIGIDEDNIPSLFSIDSNTTRLGTANEIGTGLGLILCKEFVERCNGTINVESKIGQGSVFTLKIPAIE